MKNKLKSLYLDTNLGVFFYNRPDLVSGLLLVTVAMIVATAGFLVSAALHSPWFLVGPVMGMVVFAAMTGRTVTQLVEATQERWVDERAVDSYASRQAEQVRY